MVCCGGRDGSVVSVVGEREEVFRMGVREGGRECIKGGLMDVVCD